MHRDAHQRPSPPRRTYRSVGILFALIVSAGDVAAQVRTVPYLYLEVGNQRGGLTPDADAIITVPNNERIHTRIYLKVRAVEDAFENLEIRASNQHPDYFKNRPPANMTLQVKQVLAQGTRDVPVRIVSSGGGKNITLYNVDATFDILEPREVREVRITDFLEWMLEVARKNGGANLAESVVGYREKLVSLYDEMYVNNPVGTYQITARYSPSTAENWRGVLVTDALRIRIIFKADFFDAMKGGVK